MAAFNGKWKLVGHDGVDGLCDAFALPEDKRERLRNFLASEVHDEITMSATGWNRKTLVGGEVRREVNVTFGQECEVPVTVDPTRKVKAVFTKESDTKISGVETGPKFTVNVCAEITGDGFSQTAKIGNACATMKYTKM